MTQPRSLDAPAGGSTANEGYRRAFAIAHPGVVLLDGTDVDAICRHLVSQGFAAPGEGPVRIERAGDGNMNLTLKVTLPDRTVILKQGRPWVEKYDHIAAPWARTLVEGAFYECVSRHPAVGGRMPALLHLDRANHILALEHLQGQDCTSVYTTRDLREGETRDLLDWVAALGGVPLDDSRQALFRNRAMRALNHEHIFHFPLVEENGLDLDRITPGLRDAAAGLQRDSPYCHCVAELGNLYLADGDRLVHGDYFPGSWLRTAGGVRIIDPEFCFYGRAEFDYAVMLGHLLLARVDPARALTVVAAARTAGLDVPLVLSWAGVEIMRRLIGVAQLPLPYGLPEKQDALALSRRLVMTPEEGVP